MYDSAGRLMGQEVRSVTPGSENFIPTALWKVPVAFSCLVLCAFLVVYFFSETFSFGDTVIQLILQTNEGRSYLRFVLYLCAFGIFLLLFLFDFSYWHGTVGVVARRVGVTLVAACMAIAGLLTMTSFPPLPLGTALLLLPLMAFFLRSTLFRNNSGSDVSKVMGVNFIVTSLIVLIVWLCWLGGAWGTGDNPTSNNHWFANRNVFIEKADCLDQEWKSHSTRLGSTTLCLAAFLLWSSPLFLFGVSLFLGCVMLLLSRTMTHGEASSTRFAMRLLGFACGIVIIGMYVSFSMGGAGMQLQHAAFTVFGVCGVAVVIIIGSTIGWKTLETKIHEHPLVVKMQNLGSPTIDLVHAIFVVCLPLYAIFVTLSFLNQLLRKLACKGYCLCKPLDTIEERKLTLTKVATTINNHIIGWNWTKALQYTQILCVVMWGLKYGSIITYIGANRLIDALSTLHVSVVIILFILIALVMFLIPIVPGPVVYLTSGILVVPVCEAAFGGRSVAGKCDFLPPNATALIDPAGGPGGGDGDGGGGDPEVPVGPFWLAVIVANILSYVLKLVAHVLQQKLIGEAFGRSVAVRALAKPNAPLMKAIRLLLSKPGVTIAKCAIMCGGPDWPTSVLCGLLKLPMGGLMLGLLPMFLLTIPTTLGGAFLNPPRQAYTNVTSFLYLISIAVQAASLVAVLHYVNRALSQDADEIAAIPDDDEVKRLEERSKARQAITARLTRFEAMPRWVQVVMVLSTGVLLLTFYALMVFPSRFFQPFGLTDCWSDLGVPPWNAFGQPVGISINGIWLFVLLAIGLLGMYAVSKWTSAAVNEVMARETGSSANKDVEMQTKPSDLAALAGAPRQAWASGAPTDPAAPSNAAHSPASISEGSQKYRDDL